jgi:hypothetical protein
MAETTKQASRCASDDDKDSHFSFLLVLLFPNKVCITSDPTEHINVLLLSLFVIFT